MPCPVLSLKRYFSMGGTMGRKPFIGIVLLGYLGLSAFFITLYIASLTPAEYAALKEYQDTVNSGALPNGYGFADTARLILSLLILPAVLMRLRDCGKSVLWALLLLPSIGLSAWGLIERPLPFRDDAQALMHVIFYGTLFILMLKKTKLNNTTAKGKTA